MKTQRLLALFAHILGLFIAMHSIGQPFDLDRVKDIAQFSGSGAARELLRKNGFVVADPAFKQIFEPYIKSPETAEPSGERPMGSTLPSFITVDSAWHTYHVLFEEGVKELEESQSERLAKFSRELQKAAEAQSLPEIASFAAVGLALQDSAARATLQPSEKAIVEALLDGSENVNVPVGFPLSPLQFRAQSFYTQSLELTAYFAARQWYAGVVFRLSDSRETDLALRLAALINADPDLFALWKQLSDPLDRLIGAPEDGTVMIYAAAAKGGSADRVREKLLATVPVPMISDQQLPLDEYLKFDQTTRGFRLLPPRHLPDAVCFHKSTDPYIPRRLSPSGVDFMVSSPVLRSDAALRAAQNQFGKSIADALAKIDAGPLPNSLYGDSMNLLAKLQQPLPDSAPHALRTEAWADLQLSTQLSAWAEQRHTWALHAKLSVNYMGMIDPPHGLVAPYPDFFSGLAKLSRDSASTLRQADPAAAFDPKMVAADLLAQLTQSARLEIDQEVMSAHAEHLTAFLNQYYSKHEDELKSNPAASEALPAQLQSMAARVSQTGQATTDETTTLKDYYDSRILVAGLLDGFAGTCDRLSELARKCRDGAALSGEDGKWIEGYGTTLAAYHFYYGNSYEAPADNFPVVTRVYANPRTSAVFYAGVARPQALYVIVKNQLYRGAVMTYREFTRPDSQLLDDDSWRDVVRQGQTPPAPAFTRSFYAERSFADWLAALKVQGSEDYGQRQEVLWQLGSSAQEKDLPELINLMEATGSNDADLTVALAQMMAAMPCKAHHARFIALLESDDTILSDASALVLCGQGTNLDPAPIIAGLETRKPRAQRLRLAILGSLPEQTAASSAALLHALYSSDGGVRWQAAQVIGGAQWSSNMPIDGLVQALKDPNFMVAANAARALAKLHATNAGPAVLAELRARLAHPLSDDDQQNQEAEVVVNIQDSRRGSGYLMESLKLLDPDNQLMRISLSTGLRRLPTRRMSRTPPQPGRVDFINQLNFDALDIWMQSLGDLQCHEAEPDLLQWLSSDRRTAAFSALQKLGSTRLIDQELATAKDANANSVEREEALGDLCRLNATNQVRAISSLLDDTTPIVYDRVPPGREWRICDRAADTIAGLLGWHERLRVFAPPDQRDAFVARVKQSLQ